jgi:hypothetical protein
MGLPVFQPPDDFSSVDWTERYVVDAANIEDAPE